eukprot:c8260_g1_i1.p1 GENE.c8260_g1_i1~~c8260_g1_i1.p1  ORF type:complete len:171 (-),score=41.32 c8260_g1_i1:117-629(-)
MIAIERTGEAVDGNHYTMRGKLMETVDSGIDQLFRLCFESDTCVTIGIGDGGNELGTGAVADITRQFINNGPLIACAVPAKYTVMTGTSDWGGFALAGEIHLNHPQSSWNFRPNSELRQVLESMTAAGARDGISKQAIAQVDGLSWEIYSGVVQEMASLYQTSKAAQTLQ